MTTAIRTHIIKIGNSQGVRIPKLLLDQSSLVDEVELQVEEGRIVIRPIHAPRSDWEEQFQTMHIGGDDALVDDFLMTDWDGEEWEW